MDAENGKPVFFLIFDVGAIPVVDKLVYTEWGLVSARSKCILVICAAIFVTAAIQVADFAV